MKIMEKIKIFQNQEMSHNDVDFEDFLNLIGYMIRFYKQNQNQEFNQFTSSTAIFYLLNVLAKIYHCKEFT